METDTNLYLFQPDPKSYPVIEFINNEKKDETRDSNEESFEKDYLEYIPSYLDFSQPGTYIVMFYAPWCPHCRIYKPSYIKLAKEIIHRSLSPVSFIAVSCVANEDLCTTYEIENYPTIMGFTITNINVKNDEEDDYNDAAHNGIELNTEHEPTPQSISHDLGLKLSSASITIDQLKQNKAQHVTQQQQQYNTTKFKSNLQKPKSKAAHLAAKQKLYEHDMRHPLYYIYMDAYRSLVFTLKTGIYTSSTKRLSEEKSDAFKSFLELLHLTMPSQWIGHDLVIHLQTNFDIIVQSKHHLIHSLMEFQIQEDFSLWDYYCSHGTNPFNGYTCGLWGLFHTMSIGMVEQQSSHFMTDEKMLLSPRVAADIMYDFIHHFFACHVCRANFMKMYRSCGFQHCQRLTNATKFSMNDAKEFSLWLWEVHNDVTMRTMTEYAEMDGRTISKEEMDASKWPSVRICPNCWNINRDREMTWNSNEIYSFLKIQFWPKNDLPLQPPPDRFIAYLENPVFWLVLSFLLIVLTKTYFAKKLFTRSKTE